MNYRALVQYGCGTCCPLEWQHFDASPILRLRTIPWFGPFAVRKLSNFPANAQFGDISRKLPIPDNYADAIYCCHVLEHLWRDECATALRNTYDHLKRGGIFRLVVPDLKQLAVAYVNDSNPEAGLGFISSTHLTHLERPRGLLRFARAYFGHSQHRWMWDYGGLEQCLRYAGFEKIRDAKLGDSKIEEFGAVEMPDRFLYSLCIEAQK